MNGGDGSVIWQTSSVCMEKPLIQEVNVGKVLNVAMGDMSDT
jgi:hypothetical protein